MDSPPGEVLRIAEYCGLDLVQLHGAEEPAFCAALGDRAIKALRVADRSDLLRARDYPCRAVLLDGYNGANGGREDGDGTRVDWRILRVIKIASPVIIAGGLDPGNVAGAVRRPGPTGSMSPAASSTLRGSRTPCSSTSSSSAPAKQTTR